MWAAGTHALVPALMASLPACAPPCCAPGCRLQETVPAAVRFCDASQAAALKVTADGASVCWLSPESALLCLRSGQLLQLALLPQQAGGSARHLAVARAGAAQHPSCCCSLSGAHRAPHMPGSAAAAAAGQAPQPALVFLGSAAGDSLLVRATPAAAAGTKRPAEAATGAAGEEDGTADEPASKRLRLEGIEVGSAAAAVEATAAAAAAAQGAAAAAAEARAAAGGGPAGSDSEDEEALIYGTALYSSAAGVAPAAAAAVPTPSWQLQRYQLKVLDSLANIGPLRDFAVAEPAAGAGGEAVPPALVGCSGEGKGGTLTVLRRSVVPDVITEVPLPGKQGARLGAGGPHACLPASSMHTPDCF